MSLILVTKEQADEYSLMHHRTKGSKNGQRLYQYEDGSLTPLGYIHYGVKPRSAQRAATLENKARSVKAILDDLKRSNSPDATSERNISNYNRLLDKSARMNSKLAREMEKAEKRSGANVDTTKRSEVMNLLKGNNASEKNADSNKEEASGKKSGLTGTDNGHIQKRAETRKEERESDKELEKKIKNKIEEFNEKHHSEERNLAKLSNELADADFNGASKAEVDLILKKYGVTKDGEAEKKPSFIERITDRINKKAEANRPETRKEERESEKELEKKITSGIEDFNKKSAKDAKEREEESKSFQKTMKSIRGMSDEELDANIDRLQREKRYSELLQDQRSREKGPVYTMVSKALRNAAEDLTKKSLAMAVDKIISKAKGEKTGFKLSDYKNVDLYSLDSDKLNAVSQAFNNAANIATNRWKLEHPGQDPNQQTKGNGGNDNPGGKNAPKNENQGGQNKPKNDTQANSQNQNQNGGQGGSISKNQRRKIRSMISSGMSAAEIAQRTGVSESTVRNLANGQFGNQNNQNQPDNNSGNGSGGSGNNPGNNNSSSNTSNNSDNDPGLNRLSSIRDAATASNAQRANANKRFASAIKRNRQAINAAFREGRSIDTANEREQRRIEREQKFDSYVRWVNGEAWEQEKARVRAEQVERQRQKEEEEKRKRRRERNARNGVIIPGDYD